MTAEGQSDKMASDMEEKKKKKVCNLIPPCGKKLHPITFTDAC
jgi:hypothetical protein